MAGVSTLGSAALCAVVPGGQWAWHPGGGGAALLAAAGVLGCGVQLLNTQALKLSRAAPTIAMSYVAGEGVGRGGGGGGRQASLPARVWVVWACSASQLQAHQAASGRSPSAERRRRRRQRLAAGHCSCTAHGLHTTMLDVCSHPLHPTSDPPPLPSPHAQLCGACWRTWRSSMMPPRP